MKYRIGEFIIDGLGEVIDTTIDKELTKDAVYLKNMKDLEEIKKQLSKTTFNTEQEQLFEDYTECLFASNVRACHIAYLTGIRNVIKLLQSE